MILFKPKAHKRYLSFILKGNLPSSVDPSRATIAFFVISGLDLLNALDDLKEYKEIVIEWLYQFQATTENLAGFANSLSFHHIPKYKYGHIAGTYSALSSLLILGDDLQRVDKKNIISSLKYLQLEDGSIAGAVDAAENDMRFVFCAAAISYILDDWSGIDLEKCVQYILNSISYDGGIGQGPQLESHGGSTYCAIATLTLANQLHRLTQKQIVNLIRWLLFLQDEGFKGRPNKVEDTCYTFWVGASLKMLKSHKYINEERLQNFVLSTQDFQTGGFSKWPNNYRSDPLHTYLGLAGLSLMNFEELSEVEPKLNISVRAYKHLKSLHDHWRSI